ncbi:flagellar hook-length control protein FliK [Marichromatium gracile]|uniref:flagellar hook-length control protein FliK n=1 Tax=Marichromatium gracile TaxID=1048 RepID=UPI001F2B00D7|nr:flagellar hook-length control protein FliK [Marichromatium gracile]MCF1182930.1 flagellar hook-length control protein FliK [Marichromatium gracile]
MTRDWLTQQVRLHLPQARALAETLSEWSRRLTTHEAIGTAQPKVQTPAPSTAAVPLNDRLERLISRLPAPSTLTEPGGLQRAVEGSGIWLEARLAQLALTPGALTDARLGEDLKAQLLQFADQVRRHNREATDTEPRTATPAVNNAGKALEQEAEGMLKQLVSLQLQPLEQEAEQPRWVLDLPYRHSGGVGTVQAEIEREQGQGEVEETGWTIRLRLDLSELGPLTIRLTLKGQRLSASLLAERAPTAALLRSRLPLLREQLEARELEVTALHAGQGQTANPTPHSGPLISEQA